jgi:hypothetical protein
MLTELQERIVLEKKLFLCILTPCYGGMANINYTSCLMDTLSLLSQCNIPNKVIFCKNDSLITRARNNLIAKAMMDKNVTHVLFIDSDITWSPKSILNLLFSDKPVIGGVYPRKRYRWDVLNDEKIKKILEIKNNVSFLSGVNDEHMIRSVLVDYNVNYLHNTIEVKDNIIEVRHIPTGFMMIQRETLEKMMEHYPLLKYTDDVGYLQEKENDYAYALFNSVAWEGHFLSEDWYFCKQWTDMGGSIHVDISINLNHSGMEEYLGSYAASLYITTKELVESSDSASSAASASASASASDFIN